MRHLFLLPALAISLCAPVLAGPLTPPPGAVASTQKALVEVEPRIAINLTNTPGDSDSVFRITQSGSYYLTSNLVSFEAGKSGIEIAGGNVTIDLNGFQLVGNTGTLSGVVVVSLAPNNITIRNGSVRNWGGRGIDLIGIGATNCRVENVHAESNTTDGIAVGDRGSIVNCNASGNGQAGFNGSSAVRISGCTAANNGGSGFAVGSGSIVSECIATSNSSIGIAAGFGSRVEQCIARNNSSHGISAAGACVISNNLCDSNGSGSPSSGGIRTNGAGTIIKDNQCSNGARGISVDTPGNLIIRNTCSVNTNNFSIVANNRYGPIVNITASGTAAASGSSAGSTLANTEPNANFAY